MSERHLTQTELETVTGGLVYVPPFTPPILPPVITSTLSALLQRLTGFAST